MRLVLPDFVSRERILAARRRQPAVRTRRRQRRDTLLVASASNRLAQRSESHAALGAAARGSQVGVAGGAEDVALPALVLRPVLHLKAYRALQALGGHTTRGPLLGGRPLLAPTGHRGAPVASK